MQLILVTQYKSYFVVFNVEVADRIYTNVQLVLVIIIQKYFKGVCRDKECIQLMVL